MPSRYRIEYLQDAEQEHKACNSRLADSDDLSRATVDALEGAVGARRLYGANAFQIRDTHDDWKIVARGQLPMW